MGDITISQIGGFLIAWGPVSACMFFLYRLAGRFEKLERQAAYRQEDMAAVFEALRGCLEGLIQSGANGVTAAALKKLNTYTDNKAAGLTGDGKHR